MSLHLQREMEDLKKQLLSLCALVEEQVEMAVRALVDHDAELAAAVDRRDAEIDHREVEVEEECLKALALYQPVAIDLRFVVAALKMNNDLERIGDLAVNIARKAKTLARHGSVEIPFDLCGMWEKSRLMLRDSIDALVNRDASLAHSVCARDDEVDRIEPDAAGLHRLPGEGMRLGVNASHGVVLSVKSGSGRSSWPAVVVSVWCSPRPSHR